MQDGTQDHIVAPEPFGTSPFGSWPINNQVMYQALEFAGYDVKFEMGTEAHNMKQGGADLPDALRWLWRGYPEPIVVHEPAAAHETGYDTANRVFSTIYLDKPWQQIGGEYDQVTSLTSDARGEIYFTSPGLPTIARMDPAGTISQFTDPPNDATNLRMGPHDRLYSFQRSTGAIVSTSAATCAASDQKTVVKNLTGFVDFVVTAKGTIYYLDGGNASIGFIDSSGQARAALPWAELAGVFDEMARPQGLALSPDQSMLVVTSPDSRYSWSFQIAADGSLENGEPFYRLETPEVTKPGAQRSTGGAAEDIDGMVYFATPIGIQVAMQNGRVVEILNPPTPGGGPLTAMTFAGDGDQNWLYVAQDGKLFRRPVKVMGAKAWTVVKPPKPTL